MIHTGLVSVTFRKLKAEEIIALAARAGLQGIEWGGDIHVPQGDGASARQVRLATQAAGLQVVSYGSYYRAGTYPDARKVFMEVLSTAAALEAPNIRIWAGNTPSAAADEELWKKIAEESGRIADLAQKEGIRLSFEYHGNTLTDSCASALRLMREINHPNVYSYWQPPVGLTIPERLRGLQAVKPWLSHIHVFQWKGKEKLALSEGEAEWRQYLKELDGASVARFALLEFVRDDCPGQLLEDAQTLMRMVGTDPRVLGE